MKPRIDPVFIIDLTRLYYNITLRRIITAIMVFLMFVATVLPAKQVSAYEYTEPEYTEAEEQEQEEEVEYKTTTDVDFDSSKVAIVAEVKDQRTLDT